MSGFSGGDILFILAVLGLIHGIMGVVGWLRQRKAQRRAVRDESASS